MIHENVPERLRRKVVHGWAFRAHSCEEELRIKAFLETGKVKHLPESYRGVAQVIVENDR